MSTAVDQDGDSHLGELIAGVREYLRAPERTELADGKDLAIGGALLKRRRRLVSTTSASWAAGACSPREPGLARLGPKLNPRLRRHGPVHPRALAKVSRGICPVSSVKIVNVHRSSREAVPRTAEIVGRCHHCVIPISLTVSDADGFARAIALNPGRLGRRPLRFAGSVSVPYAGAVPDGGLIRLRRPRPSAPPSSSGLGHRPFKAAARVRIPLGARAGYGCQY